MQEDSILELPEGAGHLPWHFWWSPSHLRLCRVLIYSPRLARGPHTASLATVRSATGPQGAALLPLKETRKGRENNQNPLAAPFSHLCVVSISLACPHGQVEKSTSALPAPPTWARSLSICEAVVLMSSQYLDGNSEIQIALNPLGSFSSLIWRHNFTWSKLISWQKPFLTWWEAIYYLYLVHFVGRFTQFTVEELLGLLRKCWPRLGWEWYWFMASIHNTFPNLKNFEFWNNSDPKSVGSKNHRCIPSS